MEYIILFNNWVHYILTYLVNYFKSLQPKNPITNNYKKNLRIESRLGIKFEEEFKQNQHIKSQLGR